MVPLVRSGEFFEYYSKVPKNFDTMVYILIKYGRFRLWYGMVRLPLKNGLNPNPSFVKVCLFVCLGVRLSWV